MLNLLLTKEFNVCQTMNKKALMYIEIQNNKVLNVVKEIISEAHCSLSDTGLSGIVITDKLTINAVFDELKSLNLDKIFLIEDDLFDNINTCLYSKVLSDFLISNKPDIFLMGATSFGRDLAPRTASKLNIGLTADCTQISLDENGNLLATRPTYGGQLMATIVSNVKPNFATIRSGAFKVKDFEYICNTEFITVNHNIAGIDCLLEVLSCETKEIWNDWTCSEVIVAGGLGLKSKENFELIYKFADRIGAKPAASRCAVEQGWAPQSIQVGQTGVSVSPKLYIAFGISGAMQHLVGIDNSDRIIAVNTDINAPIMKSSDYAILADATGLLQTLINQNLD